LRLSAKLLHPGDRAEMPDEGATSMAADQTLAQLVDEVCREQRECWEAGNRVVAEVYLAQHPELGSNSACAVEVLFNEMLLRRERGEVPELQEYAQRFPPLIPQLRLLLEVDQEIAQGHLLDLHPATAAMGTAGTAAQAAEAMPLPAIPGYEVLKNLGRGGMGVVYWAWQSPLNRPVALKMLLAGDQASPKELCRFRTEAEAIARLQHANFVQIYEVGRWNGRPYLSMEYVDDGSLARRLVGNPQPVRRAAELVEVLARAMHHAHQRGIVHRDLTPANILFTADGVPKITDFGLAKLLDGAGPTLTSSGTTVGTPSYMAPEQAAGHSKEVGPATDVYALGAILYELLTGRPPFKAEIPLETMRQVQMEEPIPPNRLQPKLPRDLTTICLKCLQKEPAKRYLSAEALAEDLRRYLAGEPIRARPVGAAGKVARWCRRKPAIASLAAGLALVVAGGFGGVTWQWRRAEVNAQLAQEQRKQADEQRARAETSYRLAREGLEACVQKVAENPRLKSGPLEDLRREVLQAELLFDQKFVELRGSEPEFQVQRGRTFVRLGLLASELATKEEAIGFYQQARALFADLARDHPEVPDYRANLAHSYNNLGVMYRTIGRREEAEQAYQEALAIRRVLVSDQPTRADYKASLAASLHNLAVLYQESKPLSEAEQIYQQLLPLRRELVRENPTVAAYQDDLAATCSNLGALYKDSGRLPEAERAYQDTLALRKELVAKHADMLEYQVGLGFTYNNLGLVYQAGHRLEEAERAERQALVLRKQLVHDHPLVTELAIELGGTQCNLGIILADKGQSEAALQFYAEAIATLEAASAKEPQHRTAHEFLRNAHLGRVNLLTALGRYAEALPHRDRLVQLDGQVSGWQRVWRALTLARMKEHARATAEADTLAGYQNLPADALYQLSSVYALSASAVAADAKLSEQYAARGVNLLSRAIAQGFKDVDKLQKDPELEALRSRQDFTALLTRLLNNE
jgi:tetratricopeptide (TPR) repeat protein